MVALYESLPLADLMRQLVQLERRRPPGGWSPRVAQHYRQLEDRVAELVTTPGVPDGEPIRCCLELTVRAPDGTSRAALVGLEEGGAWIEMAACWPPGTGLVLAALDAVAGAIVIGTAPGRMLVAFAEPDAAAARELVLAALRGRSPR
jgi:hypothetical protein